MKYQGGKIIIFTVLAICFFIRPIEAKEEPQAGFSVEPAIFNLEVSRGAEIQKTVRIKNIGNAPVPAVINLRDLSFADLNAKDNGRASLAPLETTSGSLTGLASWIQIKQSYFILNPGETREVSFSIAVPETAEYKSYWSFLTIEPQVESGRKGNVRIVAMVGVPLLLAVVPEDGKPLVFGGLAIEDMGPLFAARLRHLEKFVNRVLDIRTTLAGESHSDAGGNLLIIEKDPYDFNLKLKNTSNYHYYPQGTIGLYDSKNKLVASANIENRAILPGEEKNYSIRMDLKNSKIILGKYRADIDLLAYRGFDSGDKERVEKSVEFWVFPWKRILFASLLVLLFFPSIFTLLFYRKRFISAARILFGGKSLSASEYRVKKDKTEIENVYPAPFRRI